MAKRDLVRAALRDPESRAPADLQDLLLTALDLRLQDEAVACIEPMVQAGHRGDPHLWQLLGLAEQARHNAAEASVAFAKAAALAPRDAKIAHGLAITSLEAGLPAVAPFEAALRLAPGTSALLIGLASARLAEGDGEGALVHLRAVLAANPAWRDGHLAFARIAASGSTGVDPIESLVTALRHSPRDSGLWAMVLQVLMQAQEYGRALEAVGKAREHTGDTLEWRRAEAICRSELGDPGTAMQLFAGLPLLDRAAILIHPIRALIRLERFDDALALAERKVSAEEEVGLWPYRALLWRLLDDPRWAWLEGDPRLVGIYDIDPARVDIEALAAALRPLHQRSGTPIDQSVRKGTQTDGFLLARAEPQVRALREELRRLVAQHIAHLPPEDPRHPTLSPARGGFDFAGAWSVRLTGGGGHHDDHVHPLGWFSSALYVAVPEAAALGGEPDAGWLTLGECRTLVPKFEGFRKIAPKPGRLVLFPSTLWHGTRPFAEGERMTVAFDVAAVPAT